MITPWGIGTHVRALGSLVAASALLSSVLPACTATANVGDVWMSIDQDGARRREVFFTDSAGITCLAQVGIGRNDVTVEMLIRQIRRAPLGTSNFEPVDRVVSALDFHPSVTKTAPAVLALTLVPTTPNPDTGKLEEDADAPFEAGSYICEVTLDGIRQKTAAFNIDYAPCPTTVIQPKVRCLGFYMAGDKCPAAGATGDQTPTCSCQSDGWACP